MEQELKEVRAEVARLNIVEADYDRLCAEWDEKDVREAINDHYDHYAVQKGAESNAESLDPADVKPGEAWLVRDEKELSIAVRDAKRWVLTHLKDATIRYRRIQHITLVARLVPAPRVITNPVELDRLPLRAVILSTDRQADVYQKDSNGEWLDVASYRFPSRQVISMENAVTVLWEPEA